MRVDYGRGTQWWAFWWLGAVCLLVHAQTQDSPQRPLCASTHCRQGEFSGSEYHYNVNGRNYMIIFSEGDYYQSDCKDVTLDDPALPRFPRLMSFETVVLKGCAPPANVSYATTLQRLNITVVKKLTLSSLPADAGISAASFAGLSSLEVLELSAAPKAGVLEPEAGFLEPLHIGLRSLTLDRVRPKPGGLPKRLDLLRLRNTGITELPPEALTVVNLEVTEQALVSAEGAAPRLQTLGLTAPVAAWPAAPRLRVLYAALWTAPQPAPLDACRDLQELRLTYVAAARLPRGFVAACPALRTLELQMLHAARDLPPDLLLNATTLRTFKLKDSAFATLPAGLFDYSPDLTEIDLTHNGLQSLPRGLFARVVPSLRRLSLAGNKLHARDVEAVVAPLTHLRHLDLSYNPLGDLCPAGNNSMIVSRGQSAVAGMKELEQLVLAATQQTRVCADWVRTLQRLQRLDLTHNRVQALACEDLAVQRAVPEADLDLSRNPLRRVDCDEAAYDRAAALYVPAKTAKLVIDSQLECDCDAYWLARMLREGRVGVRFDPACAPPLRARALAKVPLAALTCALPPALCAPGCACDHAPEAGGVRATCGPGLRDLPLARLRRPAPLLLRALRAPGAGLRALPDALPAELRVLDVGDNGIARVPAGLARWLQDGDTRVRLARNPLACACSDLPTLGALVARQAQVLEFANTTCADGRALAAAVAACGRGGAAGAAGAGAAWAAAAAAALGLALVLTALLARPETRLRLKALLHARGVRSRWLRRGGPLDADRPFDVFVAHADADDRFVAERLVPRLEPARRLCLAYRDWPVGAWIPEQIEESVRRARCSLCVVTRALLPRAPAPAAQDQDPGGQDPGGDAHWARAMLRAAHAHALRESTPRLVLVLVDVSPAELDADLRAMLDTHPHVRWGAPCFWQKLHYALPDPRPPAPAPAPAPAPGPAPAAA